jgi:anthranilate synthase component 1
MYHPSLEEFKRKAREGNLIPVYREILADMETPVSAFKKIDNNDYAFLLESVEGGEKWARYSFLGTRPSMIFRSKGKDVEIIREDKSETLTVKTDPLDILKDLMSRYKPVHVEGLPRFFGGAVGYISYDMIRFFEKLPERNPDVLNIPDSIFIFTDNLLIFDNVAHTIKAVHNAYIEKDASEEDLERIYRHATDMVDFQILILKIKEPRNSPSKVEELLQTYLPKNYRESLQSKRSLKLETFLDISSNLKKEEFEQAVRKAVDYIEAGDLIQVVLSQRQQTRLSADPFDVYRALRTINPSPYMFYLKLKDLRLAGSSPEVLVRLENEKIEVRPIAGTRRRGCDDEEDKKLVEDLLSDPKERAEHVMLVDLGRNDVGRVSEPGTVEVNELMVIEKYSHVMHIVSNVRGILKKGCDAFDVFRSCFPAGTVSGAPKIRAMEIIEELENTCRGPYAGAVGYFSFSGNMDTCITIRTILLKDQIAYIQTGAGIVADSIPEKEYEETMNKAKAMMRAIEIAEKGLD